MNPKYYDKMSELLDDLIKQRQQEALSYKEYLEQLITLAEQVGKQESSTPPTPPGPTPAPRGHLSTSVGRTMIWRSWWTKR